MDRTTIISELENIKDKVITYEKSVARFKQANKEFEEAKNYEPRRLVEFDNKYFPEFVESKIGKKNQPKEFAYFDPRRLSKKAVGNRNSEIEKHNSTILQLKRDFDVQYEGKRQSFKIEDDKEKSEKLQLAEKELQISKEDSEYNLNMLNSIELLPKSMLSSSIIEQIIKYFSDWRVDSVKEAINLYYNEAWRIEESKKLQEFFRTVDERLTDNNEMIAKVSEDSSNTIEALSELSSAVENLSKEIDSLLDKE
ncbi:hypothetical protein ACPC58_09635 [Streptococcus sp. VTCC 12905]|uniref:hypothetical protein n=1 Tax=Streptococcus sp. VTCC 12905 TaxID=3413768 RepID=UPI0037086E5C